MSFLNDIVDTVGSVVSTVSGAINNIFGNTGGSIVKTILTGFALNQVTSSINKDNEKSSGAGSQQTVTPTPDPGVALQVPPAGENRIPVVYGTARVGGIITDVKMSADNQTMWYVLTICEVTGNLLSSGSASVSSIDDVYWNGNRIVFKSDGITTSYMLDADGNQDTSIDGLVQIYLYRDGSAYPIVPDNYTNGSLSPAYSIMPGWTSNHTMSKLVFAIVKVTYNKEKNITGMPNISFVVNNTMTLPGDCLYDYMTSTRYGAGIDPTEIKSA